MPELKLTERRIQDLAAPADKEYERYWDTEVTGLFVKVLPTGRKNYGFFDRLNGDPIWAKKLPRCSETTLASMRIEAIQWKAKIRKGENPWAVVKETKRRTVGDLCRENLAAMENRTVKPISSQHLSDRRLLTSWIEKNDLSEMELNDVSVADAELFLMNYQGRNAEMLRAWLRNCYNFAISRSYVPLGFNPWKYCEKRYEPPEPEELPRFVDREIKKLADYLRAAEANRLDIEVCPIWRSYMWFLIRTGSRPSDARKIERRWLRRQGGSWIIDHPSTKTGRKTIVLSDEVARDLARLPRRKFKQDGEVKVNQFLFSGKAGAQMCKKKSYYWYDLMRKSTGLEKPPYAIRRWFANTGRSVFDGDIKPVQQLCGWETEEIAQRYAGADENLLNALIAENAEVCNAIGARVDEVIGK